MAPGSWIPGTLVWGNKVKIPVAKAEKESIVGQVHGLGQEASWPVLTKLNVLLQVFWMENASLGI